MLRFALDGQKLALDRAQYRSISVRKFVFVNVKTGVRRSETKAA